MTLLRAILAVVAAGLISELFKFFWYYRSGKIYRLFSLGGMPSSHAALVGALFLVVYFEDGFGTTLLLAGVFGFIVLRDAFGVRWEVTRHSEALNKMTKSKGYLPAGHRFSEVVVGTLLGFLVAAVFYAATYLP